MIKLSSPKESICFNFENEDQKRFFDKAKKCDIIKNNNSVFLRKILSVKNQSLLSETLKQSKSQIFNHVNVSSYENKNLNINKSSSNLTLIPNKIDESFNPILSPRICLDDINFNNSFKIKISPKKVFSPKIVVNKNKNLRINILKEKEKENDINKENIKEFPLYTETIISEKDNTIFDIQKNLGQKIKDKYSLNTINTDCNIIPEISFSNLYTKNYIRKPVVIKFKNGFNCSNIKNQNNNEDKKDLSQEENKENIHNNNQVLKKVKTETKIKPYNFYRKSNVQPELYRSFEDLERKSLEITKRKKKSNPICTITSFKKENNLMELKESLENYRLKTKYNLKRKRRKKAKIFNNSNNNSNSIKSEIVKIKNNNINSKLNNYQNNKIEDYNSFIKKDLNNNENSRWHRQKSMQFNNINLSDINENKIKIKKNKKSNLIPKMKSEELLINNPNYENIKKKSIKINFIEENKTENIYNITLNTNDVNEAFNRFHISLNHAQDFNYKNYIIRQKYGKKHTIYENNKYQEKETKNKKKKEINKNSLINKKFIEDNKTNENIDELIYYQSHSLLPPNKNEKQIKVNKKNINGKRPININSCQQNINSMLDLEDKINKEINIHLNIINGIEIISGFISSHQKKLLKEKFFLFLNYCNQIRMVNNTTLISNMSQLSDLKYIKKIVQKRGNNHSSKRIFRNKSFNAEKQKILLLKRKEFGFFEKYENCLDFINKLRLFLIKYSTNKKNL